MQRSNLCSRWVDEAWEVRGVVASEENESTSVEPMLFHDNISQYLVKGFHLELFHDEVEGYYLNVSAPEPKVFVMWRKEEESNCAMPILATVSYGEAARAM